MMATTTLKRPVSKKRFSQNFLTDPNIAEKIVRMAVIRKDDCVLEIGAGQGMLTKFLLPAAAGVRAVEIDRDLWDGLEQQFGTNPRFRLYRGDFMQLPMEEILHPELSNVVVGNIPYHITTPILFRCLEYRERIRRLVFMVQQEVAQRMVATSGSKTYGILSVFCHFYTRARILFDVPPTVFIPRPTVNSAVIALDIRRDLPSDLHLELFHLVVRRAFQQRRKMLRNSLHSLIHDNNPPVDLSRRPEDVHPEEFIQLTRWIDSSMKIGI